MFEILLATPSVPSGPQPSSGYALFGGGHYGGITNVTDKYRYSSDACTLGTVLANARYYLYAAGNETSGLFAGGGGTVVDKYTYSSDAMAGNVAALAFSENGGAGLSSKTEARFCGGDGQMVYVGLFFYSNSTITFGTSMTVGRYIGTGVGNTTTGVILGGLLANSNPALQASKINYNADTWSTGSSLSVSRSMCAGTSTSDFGIVSRDSAGGTDKYAFANDAITTSVALVVPRAYLGAAGDAAVGIFGGGYTGAYQAITDRMNYSANTIRAGTNLSLARGYIAATSSVPGGLV